jgi:predicted alpha/beta hydrolase
MERKNAEGTITPRPLRIEAEDGFSLAARSFDPAGAPRGTVLIHGATAVPQTYYARFAGYLAKHGLRAVTYDYRGVGFSRPSSLRGFKASMTSWARLDAASMQRAIADETTVIVGHSFGGQLLGLADEVHRAAGAVLVGSQLPSIGDFPVAERPAMWLKLHVGIPALTRAFGYLPGGAGLGTDLPAGVAREWARWLAQPGYLLGSHADAAERFARFDRPVLMYSFTDDDFAPKPSVEKLIGVLRSAHVAHRRIAPADLGLERIGHFGFFRDGFRDALWGEALDAIDRMLDGRDLPESLNTAGKPWVEVRREDIEEDLQHMTW